MEWSDQRFFWATLSRSMHSALDTLDLAQAIVVHAGSHSCLLAREVQAVAVGDLVSYWSA